MLRIGLVTRPILRGCRDRKLRTQLGVTVAVTMLLGAGGRPEFLPHAAAVLTVGAAVVALGRVLEYTASV